jgi:dTDP-4-dehydrorhamnose reductase
VYILKILITGADGQLGREFQKYFIKNKINHLSTTKEKFDITKIDIMRKYLKNKNEITHIINCAAYTDVEMAETERNKAYKINTKGVENLSIISKEIDAELIHFSTDYIFPGRKNPYKENDVSKPINEYGRTKFFGETKLEDFKKKFLIRTSWLFGKYGDNFVKKVIRWAKNNETLKIVSDEISSPTYAKDLVIATINLLKTNRYGTYHITNTSCSRYEWAEYILKEVGWKGNLIKAKQDEFDLKAKRPFKSVLDNSKFERITRMKMPTWQDATYRFLKEMDYI